MRVGVDIGGTKIIAGLASEAGRVIRHAQIPTEGQNGYPAVRDRIVRLVADVLSGTGVKKSSIKQVGLACAGQIDQARKRVLFSPNLNWRNKPLGRDIEAATGLPVSLENDVNAATYGEWRFGFKKEGLNVVGIFLGTGIGGGLILNGRLFRGSRDVGGELGHITLNPHGYQCRCGNRGCFEAYCGGSYVVGRVRERLEQGYRGRLWEIVGGDPVGLHAGHVEEGYYLGDELCSEAWGEVIEYLGVGLQSVANLLNPDLILLGGGVIQGTKKLVHEARLVMKQRAMPASTKGLRVERTRLHQNAMILGAAFVSSD
ncbi:MAG: putative glucokinase [Deltaproteobacteria bacterium]|jgi:glucokinase|nr:putative glucokinase [Deltaproteobacteria bacterium]